MKVQMDALEEVIRQELECQIALETLEMKALYRRWNAMRPKDGTQEVSKDSNHIPQDIKVKVEDEANPSVAGSYPTEEGSWFEDLELF
jgi:hypothetical protein